VEECPLESVWPDVSFEVMQEKFSLNPRKGPYALRQYLPPQHFAEERRYWVMGDQIHHSSGIIPDIVYEAQKRLSIFGGVFYTIDATPDMIVEINGGESSDRKTDNTAEDFARWIKEAFAL
jgi:Uma2 family endonuclease